MGFLWPYCLINTRVAYFFDYVKYIPNNMKEKKQQNKAKSESKKAEKDADELLKDVSEPAEGEAEESEEMPLGAAILGDEDEPIIDEADLIPAKAEEEAVAVDPISMREFGVEVEETADLLSSEEKRYFMGEEEDDSEDEEQSIIDESFVPEEYEG